MKLTTLTLAAALLAAPAVAQDRQVGLGNPLAWIASAFRDGGATYNGKPGVRRALPTDTELRHNPPKWGQGWINTNDYGQVRTGPLVSKTGWKKISIACIDCSEWTSVRVSVNKVRRDGTIGRRLDSRLEPECGVRCDGDRESYSLFPGGAKRVSIGVKFGRGSVTQPDWVNGRPNAGVVGNIWGRELRQGSQYRVRPTVDAQDQPKSASRSSGKSGGKSGKGRK